MVIFCDYNEIHGVIKIQILLPSSEDEDLFFEFCRNQNPSKKRKDAAFHGAVLERSHTDQSRLSGICSDLRRKGMRKMPRGFYRIRKEKIREKLIGARQKRWSRYGYKKDGASKNSAERPVFQKERFIFSLSRRRRCFAKRCAGCRKRSVTARPV